MQWYVVNLSHRTALAGKEITPRDFRRTITVAAGPNLQCEMVLATRSHTLTYVSFIGLASGK
jgi:hypothetical protein